jgi:diguanylate cyclase (GGDEF)-like protein
MREHNSSREVGPRAGSPLWVYLTVVTAAGAVVLAAALGRLAGQGLPALLGQPLPWAIALLALVGELRPVVTNGRPGADSGDVSLTFCFAALLYWGFPVAAGIRSVISLTGVIAGRTAPFRAAFGAAQFTLGLATAGLVLSLAGIHPAPAAPWELNGAALPAVGLAAVAFFMVNFVLVGTAVALHKRAPVALTLREALPCRAFVSLVLLSAAPLVVVVMARSALLVLLFLLPLIAIYASAAMSLQREHQAHHDELTGLPNRALLFRRAATALSDAARGDQRAGFLLLDLDRFKEVNDTLGHPVGDCLLKTVAHRLAHSVRPGDVVARLGGDEFAVLLPSVREASAAREVAIRLRAALAQPVHLEGMTFEIEASVGIALYPDDADGIEQLMQRADVAMYLAKERRTGAERYACGADRNSAARLALLGDLRRGLDRGEVELHYQPKVTLADGRTCGMEALARWRHPRRGLLMPSEFIPAAEHSYLMRDLTAFVADAALAQAAQWHADGLAVQVSLNLAARDLLDAGLADVLERALARHGLEPAALILEISERVLAGEPMHAAATVGALAAQGIPISLDDFGTGYSSLVRLKQLPVAEIKIDASFIASLFDSPGNQVIVKSLVDLAAALGIRSVAEGVETAEAAAALTAMGCQAAQGWHYSGPLDGPGAATWLAGHPRALPAAAPVLQPLARPGGEAPLTPQPPQPRRRERSAEGSPC